MAFGNYNNGYNPYGGYYQPQYYQPQMQQPQMQMSIQQPVQQPQQQSYIPMIYVSGIEGAKAYFMNPSSAVFLRDSENPTRVYYKTTDAQAKPTMVAYELNEISLDEKGNEIPSEKETPVTDYLKKEDLKDLVTINDFKGFTEGITAFMNNLSNDIKKSLETAKNNEIRQYSKPYYPKKGGK